MSPRTTDGESTSLLSLDSSDNDNNGGMTITSNTTRSSYGKYDSILHEMKLFLELAIPTILLNVGFTISPLLTASVVGRKFGSMYLSSFTLGNLTGNICSFSILAGILGATDTLGPQAYGLENYKEIGLLTIRGIVLNLILLIPINILLIYYLQDLLLYVGQDYDAAYNAQQWYNIFAWNLPFFVIFQSIWKFLSSQHLMKPLIEVSLFCCVIVLPISLEICTNLYGFLGSAIAYVIFQVSQCVLLLAYLYHKQPHHSNTWPGLSIPILKEAICQYEPMMEYIHLGCGGILTQSEWIYWEAMGIIVGNLGVLELSVHTIPNQVIMALCMAPFGCGLALAIRMGVKITSVDDGVKQVQYMSTAVAILSTGLFGIVISIFMYTQSHWLFRMFTNDEDVLELAQSIWWKVCLFNTNIALFASLMGTAIGLGMQWTLGMINLGYLWIFGVPITYYFAVMNGGGLHAVWTWMNVPYACMNATLLLIFVFKDWYKVQEKIQEKDPSSSSSSSTTTKSLMGSPRLGTSRLEYGAV